MTTRNNNWSNTPDWLRNKKVEEIEYMWRQAESLGIQGNNSTVKRYIFRHNNNSQTNLILKHHAKEISRSDYDASRYDREKTYKEYVDFKRGLKEREENTHLEAYKRLKRVGKSDFVCVPFKSSHPLISIQKDAQQPGKVAITLKKRLELSNLHERYETRQRVLTQLSEILSTFEQVGIFHADLKLDNIMAVRDASASRYSLKVIDFGLAKVTGFSERGKPLRLVTYNKDGKAQLNTMLKLHKEVESELKKEDAENIKRHGTYSTAHLYGDPKRSKRSSRERDIRKRRVSSKPMPTRVAIMERDYELGTERGMNNKLRNAGRQTVNAAATRIAEAARGMIGRRNNVRNNQNTRKNATNKTATTTGNTRTNKNRAAASNTRGNNNTGKTTGKTTQQLANKHLSKKGRNALFFFRPRVR